MTVGVDFFLKLSADLQESIALRAEVAASRKEINSLSDDLEKMKSAQKSTIGVFAESGGAAERSMGRVKRATTDAAAAVKLAAEDMKRGYGLIGDAYPPAPVDKKLPDRPLSRQVSVETGIKERHAAETKSLEITKEITREKDRQSQAQLRLILASGEELSTTHEIERLRKNLMETKVSGSTSEIAAITKSIKQLEAYRAEIERVIAARTIAAKSTSSENIGTRLQSQGSTTPLVTQEAKAVRENAKAHRELGDAKTDAALRSRMFESVVATGANSANRARFATFQLTSGFQDLAIVLQNGGTFDRALLGAANNFGVMASTAGPAVAILGTLAVVAIPTLVKMLMTAEKPMISFTARTDRMIESQREQRKAFLESADAAKKLTEGYEDIQRSLDKKEDDPTERAVAGKFKEQVAEHFRKPGEFEKIRVQFEADELAKIPEQQDKTGRPKMEVELANAQQAAVSKVWKRHWDSMLTFQSDKTPLAKENLDPRWSIGENARRVFNTPGNVVSEAIDINRVMGMLKLVGRPTDGYAFGGTAQAREVLTDPDKLKSLMREAIETASRSPELIKELPKNLQEIATALAETKKLEASDAKERVKAEETAREKAKDRVKKIVTGEDVKGVGKYLGDRETAAMAGTAGKFVLDKEQKEFETRKRKIAQEQEDDTAHGAIRRRQEGMSQSVDPGAQFWGQRDVQRMQRDLQDRNERNRMDERMLQLLEEFRILQQKTLTVNSSMADLLRQVPNRQRASMIPTFPAPQMPGQANPSVR